MTPTPFLPSSKCWSRKPGITATGASTGSNRHPGSPRARPGRPSSTTECPSPCASNWTKWPRSSFVEHGVNVLAFGLPGTCETQALCALRHRLVETGRSVLFHPLDAGITLSSV